MIESGGWPVVVTEDDMERRNRLGRETTGIDVDHTGSAGLAGLLALSGRTGMAVGDAIVPRGERIAVILSGVRRR